MIRVVKVDDRKGDDGSSYTQKVVVTIYLFYVIPIFKYSTSYDWKGVIETNGSIGYNNNNN